MVVYYYLIFDYYDYFGCTLSFVSHGIICSSFYIITITIFIFIFITITIFKYTVTITYYHYITKFNIKKYIISIYI